jgi:hypothetical protein
LKPNARRRNPTSLIVGLVGTGNRSGGAGHVGRLEA